jgi:hypothetical protein
MKRVAGLVHHLPGADRPDIARSAARENHLVLYGHTAGELCSSGLVRENYVNRTG